jgi:hypothetical protein
MKKLIFSIFSLSLLTLASCQRDDDPPAPSAAQQILGKWRLQKAIDEYYHPVNTLIDTDEIIGEPGDSVVFKSDNKVYVYSPTDGDDVTSYLLLNDTTIRIEDEIYKIRKLDARELYLYQEYVQQQIDERYVQRLYFVR